MITFDLADTTTVHAAITSLAGWSTAKQLAQALHPVYPEWEVEQIAEALAAAEFVERREQLGHTQYAITSACRSFPTGEAP